MESLRTSNQELSSDDEDSKNDSYDKYKVTNEMGKEEMHEMIESQKKEIKYLSQKVQTLLKERDDMVDNFKLSSGVLLERLKDLEAQHSLGERPQTASVLSKISAEANGKRIGQLRGRSKSKKGGNAEEEEQDHNEANRTEPMLCPNCKQIFQAQEMVTHTVICYRNSTKCKICGEIIQKDRKKDHLQKWRDLNKLIKDISDDNEEEASLFFDHGIDANLFFQDDPEGWTPMHYAAKSGSLNVLIGLISRGAGVDPPDQNLKTPLIVAIENKRAQAAKSLIELGADIEARDSLQKTPLMFACRMGSKEMVELLLQYKADLKATNSLGDSCISFAQKCGNPEVMMLLVKNGASIRPQSNKEIKCPLCSQDYNETDRMPRTIPDCGHSFCSTCIIECYQIIQEEYEEELQKYVHAMEESGGETQMEEPVFTFRCPEDEVLCSIQKPELLPKNFALLKIVQKTKESQDIKNKKIVWLDYKTEEKKFVVQKPKTDNSLAKFLTTPNKSQGKASQITQIVPPQKPMKDPQSQELCKLHGRPIELICVDDKIKICAQCALFGPHKGHDVRMEEEVMNEIALKVEVLIEMYQAMELSVDELGVTDNYDKQMNIFRAKQNEMKDRIHDKFKEWRRALRAVEMKVIDQVYLNYAQFEDKFHLAYNHNNKIINDAQSWMERAKQQLDDYTVKTTQDSTYVPFDMLENKKSNAGEDILFNGEQLIERAEKEKGYPSLNALESSYNQVRFWSEPHLEKKLGMIAKVYTERPGVQNEFSGDFTTVSGSFLPPFEEEDNNDGVSHMNKGLGDGALNLSNISFNEPNSPINQTQMHLEANKEDLMMYQTQSLPLETNSLRRMSTTKPVPSSQMGQQQQHPKKRTDLATMFKNDIVQGELDLSSKNLSDMHSFEIAKLLKTSHVKHLNLSKNKISDDAVLQIVKALCESASVESVNLQNNKLSEKCVEAIVGILKTNKTLKMLDLQNNGIGSKVMKNKLKNGLPQMEMPIDISLLRQETGADPEVVRKSQIARFKDPAIVDEIISIDHEWRKLTFQVDNLKKEHNELSKLIGNKIKESKGAEKCEEEKARSNDIKNVIDQTEKQKDELTDLRNKKLNTIGNIVYHDVPISKDEAQNGIASTWGQIPELQIDGKTLGHLHHHEIMQCLDMVEFERGQKIAGHRGYFLKGVGVLLNQSLINYGLNFLSAKEYTAVQPPFFMKQSIMEETCQLSDFEDNLYKVVGSSEDEANYLIATSEQPISAMYRKEWIEPTDLPIRFAGVSSCFRKEAGAHGKDVWGIFRVHQFEKVEQFCLTVPEKSWEMLEEMIKIAEDYYKGLELPYRVVNIVSGELNDAASKKYDLEAWFPGYGTFRELVSCSNCTDFQSRGLEVRLQVKNTKEKVYVHMLNATLCATERTMCCILENYQTPEGVRVPTVLQPYFGGKEFLPYNQKATEEFFKKKAQEEEAAKKKQKK